LCCLEISSRTAHQRESWSVIIKVFQYSRLSTSYLSTDLLCIHFTIRQGSRQIYSGAALRWRRERPGTTVCIRDAFYNVCLFRHWLLSENDARNLLPSQSTAQRRTHSDILLSASSETQFTPQPSTYNGAGHQGTPSFSVNIPESVVYSRQDWQNKRRRAEPYKNASHSSGIVLPSFEGAGGSESHALQTSSTLQAFRLIHGRALAEVCASGYPTVTRPATHSSLR
jgi:hypothetical protein